ncbi:MAG: phosphoribosylformylglycinamidine synthase subunit PurL, partial [Bacteroidetes bacterium]|nr:phosphoribosylformylglycinamidine synthase subunit PurL [Bacteroidota bacterium]
VGDPFTEKLLLEATLEAIQSGHLVGIQDMGAAGITCSSSEMSAKGKSGIELELSLVPTREDNMTPYEILLSESQERMLLVVQKGHEQEIQQIFEKWDLHAVTIGKVTDDGLLRVKYQDRLFAEIPSDSLVLGGGAPIYYREAVKPAYLETVQQWTADHIDSPSDLNAVLKKLLVSPNIASKEWVYDQYDSMVRTNTVSLPGSDSAVLRIKGTDKAIALKVDCNGRYVYLNPRRGGQIAVAESARNVVCSGARPAAITNCLNFGNPYKPENYWQFKEAVGGMGDACLVFETPVTGGNVSFYNESPTAAVFPTPTIGMLGIVENLNHVTTSHFKREGDVVLLIGDNKPEGGGCEYLRTWHNIVMGDAPTISLKYEKAVQDAVYESIIGGYIQSAHDVSDGGLAVCLAECCFQRGGRSIGAAITLGDRFRPDLLLFGESQSRIVVTAKRSDVEKVSGIAAKHGVTCAEIGTVGGTRLIINSWIDESTSELERLYRGAIGSIMD